MDRTMKRCFICKTIYEIPTNQIVIRKYRGKYRYLCIDCARKIGRL